MPASVTLQRPDGWRPCAGAAPVQPTFVFRPPAGARPANDDPAAISIPGTAGEDIPQFLHYLSRTGTFAAIALLAVLY